MPCIIPGIVSMRGCTPTVVMLYGTVDLSKADYPDGPNLTTQAT